MSVDTRQPIASIPRGISGGGPTSVTRAPIRTSAWMFERATRECRTSPTIATCSPSILPSSSSIVYRSSRACVGCWCLPSPALTTCAPVSEATSCGAPICGWRMTITSGSYASRVSAVSFSDSPLSTAEPAALIDITSAESRFAASSKLDDVRVDDSKKRLTTVRPRSVGSFFISRSSDRAKLRAVPSSRTTSSRVRSAIEIRCRRGGGAGGGSSSPMTWISALAMGLFFSLLDQQHPVDLVDLEELYLDALVAPGGQVLADVVGADRQLAMATVGEDGELDAGRAAVVEERLDRGADRPARVEDVVDEDAGLSLEQKVEACRADERLRVERRVAAADRDVVPVERDVDGAELDLGAREVLDQATEALGERHPARVDADERDLVELGVALDDLVRNAVERPVERLGVEEHPLADGRLGGLGHVLSFPASPDRVKG